MPSTIFQYKNTKNVMMAGILSFCQVKPFTICHVEFSGYENPAKSKLTSC